MLMDNFKVIRLPLSRNRPDVRLLNNRIWPPLLQSRGRAGEKKKTFVDSENDKVMSEQNNNRNKWLHLRLKPDEYEKINRQFDKTTCRKLSDYARKILLGKPTIATTRDQSFDD